MSAEIDNKIAGLEKQLNELRRQKLSALESEMAALRSAMGGESGRSSGGRTPRATAAPAAASSAKGKAKGPGGRRGKRTRFTDEDAVAALTEAVRGGGKAGIPGREASKVSGVSYPRAMQLLGANFKRTGSGKWTRFTLK